MHDLLSRLKNLASQLNRPLQVGGSKTFRAVVQSADGANLQITTSAPSRARARQLLIQQGHRVVSLSAQRPWWDITFGKSVKAVVVLQVTRQLAAFTTAGVPILQGLEMLARTTQDRRMKSALASMAQDIKDGESLADAARVYKEIFPSYYLAILEASQRSGELQSTFETLSDYLERDLEATRAIKSALFYPVMLIVMAIISISVISTYVLPRFVVFFDSLQTQLPWSTRALLFLVNLFQGYWWVGAGLMVTGAAAFFIYRRRPGGRLHIDTIMLRVPLIGNLIQLVALERFSRTLGSLSQAGVPISDALSLTGSVMTNRAFEVATQKVRSGVVGGLGLSQPMSSSGIFPEETVQILRVGEQTGRLTEQLNHAATYYSKELTYKLKTLTTLLEPIVLVLVGGGVGFVAVALVSAMYGIYSGVGLQ